jgi:radical SAM protein with 4Fe4S-binding SPASM domain
MKPDKYGIDSHKLHYHTERIEQWKKAPHETFPIYIEISPVGYCNHRCTFCAVDYLGYKTIRLNKEVLIPAIRNMAQNGVKSIMFAGEGEPLLHPHISEIINETARAGIKVGITTNGVALTGKLVQKCMQSISWIKVSMNGGSTSYEKIHVTREEDYERVWRNIELAADWKDMCPEVRTVLGIQTVLLPENAQDIEELAGRARDTGLDYLVVKPYSQHKKSLTTKYSGITYSPYKGLFTRLREFNTDKFEVIAREQAMDSWDEPGRAYSKCYSTPYFWAYVMATGDVYGCSAYLNDPQFCYGNIKKERFEDIWLGDKRRECAEYVRERLCIDDCRKNCRMEKVNRYLWDLMHPNPHKDFI